MSLLIPGLSQLLQGRPILGLLHFIFAAALWCCGMGWVVHLASYLNASAWEKQKENDKKTVRAFHDAYMHSAEEYGRKYDHGYGRREYR